MAIDRREFMQMGAAATLAAATDLRAENRKKPYNILYVFSDQHRHCSLPGDDVNEIVAPHLEAFRRQNFEMANCISNYPLCAPYRGIFMSGRWPQQTGVIQNGPSLPTSELGLGEHFRRNGYHTGYVGKWHLGGGQGFIPKGAERFGFEDWHVWVDTNAHYHSWTYDPDTGARIPGEGYNATLMTDQAITFLDGQKKAEKPWLLVLSWNPPHPPYNPPPADQADYNRAQLKLRPNVRFIPEYIAKKGPRFPGRNQESLREAMQGYFGGITAVDQEFGRILKTLEANGQADDTIVIYSCDHGDLMGSHGRLGKMTPHEESCHVPFMIRIPGVTGSGQKSDTLFASIDIYPTLCGLAGIPVPAHCQGRDFSAVFHGQPVKPSEQVFLMANTNERRGSPEGDLPSYRGLRTATHTYAVMKEGRWCLYDNVKDPFQLKNLVNDPQYKPLMEQFDATLQGWLDHCKDPFPLQSAVKKFANSPFV